jgi:hypothetical protein
MAFTSTATDAAVLPLTAPAANDNSQTQTTGDVLSFPEGGLQAWLTVAGG